MQNISVVELVLRILNKPEDLIEYVADRPRHDFRYALDTTKIRTEIGWKPEIDIMTGFTKTVEWYITHQN